MSDKNEKSMNDSHKTNNIRCYWSESEKKTGFNRFPLEMQSSHKT